MPISCPALWAEGRSTVTVVPLPGFVKRRAEVRILNTVKELKARAEA